MELKQNRAKTSSMRFSSTKYQGRHCQGIYEGDCQGINEGGGLGTFPLLAVSTSWRRAEWELTCNTTNTSGAVVPRRFGGFDPCSFTPEESRRFDSIEEVI